MTRSKEEVVAEMQLVVEQMRLDDIEEKRWTSDKCTSGSGIGLLNGEGAGCAARLTIPLK